MAQNRNKQTWRTLWREDMTQGPKPRSGQTRLFSATHFYAALNSWAFAASQERCGGICGALAPPARGSDPGPAGSSGCRGAPGPAPVTPIPTVLPLLGAAAAPADRSPRPKVRCGAVLDSGLALRTALASHLPRDGSPPPPAYLGSSGGAGAAGGARPVPGRGGARDTPLPR